MRCWFIASACWGRPSRRRSSPRWLCPGASPRSFRCPTRNLHGAEAGLFDSRRFMALYTVSIGAAAALVGVAHDLVWVNIATQVANALLFPLIVGLLIALAAGALAPPLRLRGPRLAIMVFLAASVAAIGVVGAVAAFL